MMKVFAVFDVKAAAYGTPMFLPTRGLAVRGFSDACADPRSPMCQHPADYSMRELGEYDPLTGRMVSYPEPVLVLEASAVVAERVRARLEREPELPGLKPGMDARLGTQGAVGFPGSADDQVVKP